MPKEREREFFSESNSISGSRDTKDESTEGYLQRQVGLGYQSDIHRNEAKTQLRKAGESLEETQDYIFRGETRSDHYFRDSMRDTVIAQKAEAIRKARLRNRIGIELSPEEAALLEESTPWKDLPSGEELDKRDLEDAETDGEIPGPEEQAA